MPKTILNYLLLTIMLQSAAMAAIGFAPEKVAATPSYILGDVDAADIDGDGDIDLLSGTYYDTTLIWFENNGSGSFSAHAVTTTVNLILGVYVADVDNDGDMDLLSASSNDNTIAWYENDGSENFTQHTISTAVTEAKYIYAADLDGDGDIDLFSISESPDTLTWHENDGNENFTPHVIVTGINGAANIDTVDLDGDGDIDLICTSDTDGTVAWFENDGSENFTKHDLTAFIGSITDGYSITVNAIDIDSDGDIDLLAGSPYDNSIAWYENDGNENFTKHVVSTAYRSPSDVSAVDVDGDGDVDLFASFWSDKNIVWYENDGSENFTMHVYATTLTTNMSIDVVDLDGDGKRDLVSSNNTYIAWYRQVAQPSNILLSSTTIPEAAAPGRQIGVFSATDADADDTHTFTLECATPGVNDANFSISSAGWLSNSIVFDYETTTTQSICVRATDSFGLTYDKVFTITITDVDEIPDSFNVTDLQMQGPSTTVASAPLTPTGFVAPASIAISGANCYYAINGGTFTNAAGTIAPGANVTLQTIASPDYVSTVSCDLDIGGISDTWYVTTHASHEPSPYSFADLSEQTLSNTVATASITITGLGMETNISISGTNCFYAIDGGSFTDANGTISNEQNVTLQTITPETIDSITECTVTIGGVSDTWSVSTPYFHRARNGVTITCDNAALGDTGVVDGVTYTKRASGDITVANAATTCTSGITDMSRLFNGEYQFNEDITHWDTSSVTDMSEMFRQARVFDQNISSWDTSGVTDMFSMFRTATEFNQNISSWCVHAIVSKPASFDSLAYFYGQSDLQPQWGSCPPDAFHFTDVSGQATSTVVVSDDVNFFSLGKNGSATLSISGSGCRYAINHGSFSNTNATVFYDDNITLTTTTAAAYDTAVDCNLTIDGISDIWRVATTAIYAPTAITLTPDSIAEHQAVGTVVGSFSASDVDAGDTHTFSLTCNGVNDGNFTIADDNVTLKSNHVFDYATTATQSICVRATDSYGLTYDENLTVTVTNVNETPVVTSTAVTSATQGNPYSYTLGATDADGDLLSWGETSGSSLPAWLSLQSGGAWTTVGSAGFSAANTEFTSIVFDGNNVPYVAYYDGANGGRATVKKYADGSWTTVGNAGFSAGYARYITMAFDGSNTPYVAYVDGGNGDRATAMKFEGSSWVNVGSAGFSAAGVGYTSLALEGSGTPYVSFTDGANAGKATVMKFDGANWVTVGTAGFSAGTVWFTSLAIDGSGTPYVAYNDWANANKATVMTFDGSDWVSVGTSGFSAGRVYYPSLSIDNTTPYVAYRDEGNANAGMLMKFDGSSWVSVGNAGFSVGAASYVALVLSGNGTPYVAYADGDNGNKATVVKYEGSSWVSVGNTGFSSSTASFLSIALDGSGIPYVAYSDGANGDKATVMKPLDTVLVGTPTNADVGTHDVNLTISDRNGGSATHNFTITVANVNDAPTALSLSGTTVTENSAVATAIGTLSTTDADVNDTHTYSFCGGTDDGAFGISAATLQTAVALDYESGVTHSICIRTTDSGSATFDANFTITVANVDESVDGICGSADGNTFNTIPVANLCKSGTASMVSENAGDYNWTCSGTTVGSDTGAVATCSALRSYAPVSIILSGMSVMENSAAGTSVGNLSTNANVTGYGWCGGTDDGEFAISGTTLQTAVVLDYESGATRHICIRATYTTYGASKLRAASATFDQNFTITVTNDVSDDVAVNAAVVTVPLFGVPGGAIILALLMGLFGLRRLGRDAYM